MSNRRTFDCWLENEKGLFLSPRLRVSDLQQKENDLDHLLVD